MDPETAEVENEGGKKVKPKTLLAIGEKRFIKGAAKDPYVQKR